VDIEVIGDCSAILVPHASARRVGGSMTPYTAFVNMLVGAIGLAFAARVWRFLRDRRGMESGPFPDVPDAPSMATPMAAPGITGPYSSLDPYAPPKRLANGTRVDGLPEGE
jgi:hypothetical protein